MSKPTLTLTVESVVLAGSTGRVTLHGTAEAVHHLLSHAFRMVAGPWQSGTYGGFHRLAALVARGWTLTDGVTP